MKIYTVGPITGIPGWERQFEIAKERLSRYGDIVLSPLDYPKGLTQKEYMILSVQNVFMADLILRLKGWEVSKGALAEVALAYSIGTQVEEYSEARNIRYTEVGE